MNINKVFTTTNFKTDRPYSVHRISQLTPRNLDLKTFILFESNIQTW